MSIQITSLGDLVDDIKRDCYLWITKGDFNVLKSRLYELGVKVRNYYESKTHLEDKTFESNKNFVNFPVTSILETLRVRRTNHNENAWKYVFPFEYYEHIFRNDKLLELAMAFREPFSNYTVDETMLGIARIRTMLLYAQEIIVSLEEIYVISFRLVESIKKEDSSGIETAVLDLAKSEKKLSDVILRKKWDRSIAVCVQEFFSMACQFCDIVWNMLGSKLLLKATDHPLGEQNNTDFLRTYVAVTNTNPCYGMELNEIIGKMKLSVPEWEQFPCIALPYEVRRMHSDSAKSTFFDGRMAMAEHNCTSRNHSLPIEYSPLVRKRTDIKSKESSKKRQRVGSTNLEQGSIFYTSLQSVAMDLQSAIDEMIRHYLDGLCCLASEEMLRDIISRLPYAKPFQAALLGDESVVEKTICFAKEIEHTFDECILFLKDVKEHGASSHDDLAKLVLRTTGQEFIKIEIKNAERIKIGKIAKEQQYSYAMEEGIKEIESKWQMFSDQYDKIRLYALNCRTKENNFDNMQDFENSKRRLIDCEEICTFHRDGLLAKISEILDYIEKTDIPDSQNRLLEYRAQVIATYDEFISYKEFLDVYVTDVENDFYTSEIRKFESKYSDIVENPATLEWNDGNLHKLSTEFLQKAHSSFLTMRYKENLIKRNQDCVISTYCKALKHIEQDLERSFDGTGNSEMCVSNMKIRFLVGNVIQDDKCAVYEKIVRYLETFRTCDKVKLHQSADPFLTDEDVMEFINNYESSSAATKDFLIEKSLKWKNYEKYGSQSENLTKVLLPQIKAVRMEIDAGLEGFDENLISEKWLLFVEQSKSQEELENVIVTFDKEISTKYESMYENVSLIEKKITRLKKDVFQSNDKNVLDLMDKMLELLNATESQVKELKEKGVKKKASVIKCRNNLILKRRKKSLAIQKATANDKKLLSESFSGFSNGGQRLQSLRELMENEYRLKSAVCPLEYKKNVFISFVKSISNALTLIEPSRDGSLAPLKNKKNANHLERLSFVSEVVFSPVASNIEEIRGLILNTMEGNFSTVLDSLSLSLHKMKKGLPFDSLIIDCTLTPLQTNIDERLHSYRLQRERERTIDVARDQLRAETDDCFVSIEKVLENFKDCIFSLNLFKSSKDVTFTAFHAMEISLQRDFSSIEIEMNAIRDKIKSLMSKKDLILMSGGEVSERFDALVKKYASCEKTINEIDALRVISEAGDAYKELVRKNSLDTTMKALTKQLKNLAVLINQKHSYCNKWLEEIELCSNIETSFHRVSDITVAIAMDTDVLRVDYECPHLQKAMETFGLEIMPSSRIETAFVKETDKTCGLNSEIVNSLIKNYRGTMDLEINDCRQHLRNALIAFDTEIMNTEIFLEAFSKLTSDFENIVLKTFYTKSCSYVKKFKAVATDLSKFSNIILSSLTESDVPKCKFVSFMANDFIAKRDKVIGSRKTCLETEKAKNIISNSLQYIASRYNETEKSIERTKTTSFHKLDSIMEACETLDSAMLNYSSFEDAVKMLRKSDCETETVSISESILEFNAFVDSEKEKCCSVPDDLQEKKSLTKFATDRVKSLENYGLSTNREMESMWRKSVEIAIDDLSDEKRRMTVCSVKNFLLELEKTVKDGRVDVAIIDHHWIHFHSYCENHLLKVQGIDELTLSKHFMDAVRSYGNEAKVRKAYAHSPFDRIGHAKFRFALASYIDENNAVSLTASNDIQNAEKDIHSLNKILAKIKNLCLFKNFKIKESVLDSMQSITYSNSRINRLLLTYVGSEAPYFGLNSLSELLGILKERTLAFSELYDTFQDFKTSTKSIWCDIKRSSIEEIGVTVTALEMLVKTERRRLNEKFKSISNKLDLNPFPKLLRELDKKSLTFMSNLCDSAISTQELLIDFEADLIEGFDVVMGKKEILSALHKKINSNYAQWGKTAKNLNKKNCLREDEVLKGFDKKTKASTYSDSRFLNLIRDNILDQSLRISNEAVKVFMITQPFALKIGDVGQNLRWDTLFLTKDKNFVGEPKFTCVYELFLPFWHRVHCPDVLGKHTFHRFIAEGHGLLENLFQEDETLIASLHTILTEKIAVPHSKLFPSILTLELILISKVCSNKIKSRFTLRTNTIEEDHDIRKLKDVVCGDALSTFIDICEVGMATFPYTSNYFAHNFYKMTPDKRIGLSIPVLELFIKSWLAYNNVINYNARTRQPSISINDTSTFHPWGESFLGHENLDPYINIDDSKLFKVFNVTRNQDAFSVHLLPWIVLYRLIRDGLDLTIDFILRRSPIACIFNAESSDENANARIIRAYVAHVIYVIALVDCTKLSSLWESYGIQDLGLHEHLTNAYGVNTDETPFTPSDIGYDELISSNDAKELAGKHGFVQEKTYRISNKKITGLCAFDLVVFSLCTGVDFAVLQKIRIRENKHMWKEVINTTYKPDVLQFGLKDFPKKFLVFDDLDPSILATFDNIDRRYIPLLRSLGEIPQTEIKPHAQECLPFVLLDNDFALIGYAVCINKDIETIKPIEIAIDLDRLSNGLTQSRALKPYHHPFREEFEKEFLAEVGREAAVEQEFYWDNYDSLLSKQDDFDSAPDDCTVGGSNGESYLIPTISNSSDEIYTLGEYLSNLCLESNSLEYNTEDPNDDIVSSDHSFFEESWGELKHEGKPSSVSNELTKNDNFEQRQNDACDKDFIKSIAEEEFLSAKLLEIENEVKKDMEKEGILKEVDTLNKDPTGFNMDEIMTTINSIKTKVKNCYIIDD